MAEPRCRFFHEETWSWCGRPARRYFVVPAEGGGVELAGRCDGHGDTLNGLTGLEEVSRDEFDALAVHEE